MKYGKLELRDDRVVCSSGSVYGCAHLGHVAGVRLQSESHPLLLAVAVGSCSPCTQAA